MFLVKSGITMDSYISQTQLPNQQTAFAAEGFWGRNAEIGVCVSSPLFPLERLLLLLLLFH